MGFNVWKMFKDDIIVGQCICNDRRWPETFRVMGLKGAEMVVLGYNTPTDNVYAPHEPPYLRVFAEALGEQLEDPLLLYSALYGVWAANLLAFNGDVLRDLAEQFVALAEKQGAAVPLMIGHRLMGMSLLHTGDIVDWRCDLGKTSGLRVCAIDRSRFGCLAILRPLSRILNRRSKMHARSATLPR
jgi:hypothetical protein